MRGRWVKQRNGVSKSNVRGILKTAGCAAYQEEGRGILGYEELMERLTDKNRESAQQQQAGGSSEWQIGFVCSLGQGFQEGCIEKELPPDVGLGYCKG